MAKYNQMGLKCDEDQESAVSRDDRDETIETRRSSCSSKVSSRYDKYRMRNFNIIWRYFIFDIF